MTPAKAEPGALPLLARDHERQERQRHDRELLEQHGARQRGGRQGKAAPGDEREGEHQQQQAGGVVLPEPCRAHRDRVADEHCPERQPPAQRPAEHQRCGQQREGRQQDQEAVVVERLRQHPPDRRADHGAGEVGEVLERHLTVAHPLRDRAVARVEALESRLAVVVAVGVVEIAHQLAAQLHLVGRVVREEPGCGRVAEAELEEASTEPRAGSRPTSTRATPQPARIATGRLASRKTANAPHRSAATKVAARAMPTSHSSPAARTSGASGPWGSTSGGRKRQGSEPSSGSVMAISANRTPVRTHPSRSVMPVPSPAAAPLPAARWRPRPRPEPAR